MVSVSVVANEPIKQLACSLAGKSNTVEKPCTYKTVAVIAIACL